MRRRATGSTYTLSYLDDPPSFRLRIDRAEVNLLTSHSQLSTSQISSSFSSSSSSSSPSSSSSYPSSPSSVLQTHSELKIIREHPIESAIYLQPPPISPPLSPSLSLTPSLPLPPHLIESSVIESRISIQLLRPDLLILMEGGGGGEGGGEGNFPATTTNALRNWMFLLSSFLKPTDQIQSKTAEWP